MKSTLSLALLVALVGSTIPLTGQERAPGPIARSLAHQAVQLAAVPQGNVVDARWSHVRDLAPGTEIIVITRSAPPRRLYLVSTTDSELTILNLTDPSLPRAVTRMLRDMVAYHADYLAGVRKGQYVDRDLRVGPDGVFFANQKVADLSRIVETIARTAVTEVRTLERGQGLWGHLGPLGGYFLGAMTGGVAAGLVCRAAAGRNRCDTGAFLAGAVGGGIAGGVHGFRATNRETEDIVYRAP
jgi:hypothetical protein